MLTELAAFQLGTLTLIDCTYGEQYSLENARS
jgi:hypothetical protein